MTDTGAAAVLAAIAAMFPAGIHLGVLRGAPIRPPVGRQKSELERLLFRHLRLLMAVNGALTGSTVFFAKTGETAAALVSGSIAVPTILAQTACLVIAKFRDVAELPRQR